MILMRTKERMRKRLKDAKGFTLVEMIVVLAIIAILIALIAPNVAKLIGNAQNTSNAAKSKTIMTAAQTHGTDAVAAGFGFVNNAADLKAIGTGYVMPLKKGNASSRMKSMFRQGAAGAAGAAEYAVPFMDTSGDSYLPSNTLQGTEMAYIYYSRDGVVMGAVFAGGTGGTEIKGVAGTAPDGVTAPGNEAFGNNLVGGTIDATSGICKPR